MVHARWHDLDPVRIRAIETGELGGLGATGRQDGVRAGDDIGFRVDAQLRLRIAGFSLDPRQRVKRRHERELQLVLQLVTRDAGQPIVRVDDVGGIVSQMPEDRLRVHR